MKNVKEFAINSVNIETIALKYTQNGIEIDPTEALDINGIFLYSLFEAHPKSFTPYETLALINDLLRNGKASLSIGNDEYEIHVTQFCAHGDEDEWEDVCY